MRIVRVLWLAGVTLFALFAVGCNVLDPLDSSLIGRTESDRLAQGRIALENGDYERALEVYDTLLRTEGGGGAESLRGKGEALAGLAGFNALQALDALQNRTGPNDASSALFRLVRMTRDLGRLEEGVSLVQRAEAPDRADRLSRALMRLTVAVEQLIQRYDTNHNRRLDAGDEFAFDLDRGTATPTLPIPTTVAPAVSRTWKQLHRDLVTGPSAVNATLEDTFEDLFQAFDGRGTPWTFFSPLKDRQAAGTFTEANRQTILAASDLARRLRDADVYYGVNNASFARALQALDGAE